MNFTYLFFIFCDLKKQSNNIKHSILTKLYIVGKQKKNNILLV